MLVVPGLQRVCTSAGKDIDQRLAAILPVVGVEQVEGDAVDITGVEEEPQRSVGGVLATFGGTQDPPLGGAVIKEDLL